VEGGAHEKFGTYSKPLQGLVELSEPSIPHYPPKVATTRSMGLGLAIRAFTPPINQASPRLLPRAIIWSWTCLLRRRSFNLAQALRMVVEQVSAAFSASNRAFSAGRTDRTVDGPGDQRASVRAMFPGTRFWNAQTSLMWLLWSVVAKSSHALLRVRFSIRQGAYRFARKFA